MCGAVAKIYRELNHGAAQIALEIEKEARNVMNFQVQVPTKIRISSAVTNWCLHANVVAAINPASFAGTGRR